MEQKTLTFKNKRVRDAISKKTTDNYTAIRNQVKNVPDKMFTLSEQLGCINNLFMNTTDTNNSEKVSVSKVIEKEIKAKISGYAKQDKDKGLFDKKLLINYDECVEKIVASKLKCYYCHCNLNLLYKEVRQPDQWTLERLDNDECHSSENTVICCLACNIKRRRQDTDSFMMTKNMNIVKKSEAETT
tara:strand:+ start:1618 stop:2178 length:561 start_codon:yes stop_codon:yes gene_type:complete